MSITFLSCGDHQLSRENLKLQIWDHSVTFQAKNINPITCILPHPWNMWGWAVSFGVCVSMALNFAAQEISMSHLQRLLLLIELPCTRPGQVSTDQECAAQKAEGCAPGSLIPFDDTGWLKKTTAIGCKSSMCLPMSPEYTVTKASILLPGPSERGLPPSAWSP